MHTTFKLALGTAAILAAFGASAQTFPAAGKSITIVVPFSAGGPTDRVARDLAEALRKPLGGATVVVDNAAGAGSTIGTAKAFRAPADGYTLLVAHIGMATTATLYRNPGFKYDEFEYLGLINEVPMVVVGKPGLAAKNWAELSSWITTNKNKVNLANAGLGAASHLCGLMLQNALKTELTTVPYKGTAPAMTDLLGGQVDIMCDQTTNTTSQVEAGKIKAYAVSTAKRLTTPAAVLKTLNDALKAALKDPEFIKKQEGLGAVVVNDARANPAEHKKFVEAEIAKWGPVIKAAGQYAD